MYLLVKECPLMIQNRHNRRYGIAHLLLRGGKDGHPYPLNRVVYDESIDFLKKAIAKSKIGMTDRMHAFKRLNTFYTA